MCRSCVEGGRRCDADSSLKRRLRRKASEAIQRNTSVSPNNNPNYVDNVPLVSLEEIKTMAQKLQYKLNSPLMTNEQQDVIDLENEKMITELGSAIADYAEQHSQFDMEKFEEERDDLSQELEDATQFLDDKAAELFEAEDALTSDPDNEELKQKFDTAKVNMIQAEELYEQALTKDDDRVQIIRDKVLDDLARSYVSVLKEIREMGGSVISQNDYDSPELLSLMNESVGKFYPTDWIKASNDAQDNLRIKSTEGRSHYVDSMEQNDIELTEENTVETAEVFYIYPVPVKKLKTLEEKLQSNIEVFDANSLNLNEEECKVVKVPAKIVFDKNIHDMLPDGTPAGSGWTKEYYIDNERTGQVSEEKIWVKDNIVKKVMLPEISISVRGKRSEQEAIAIHEFAHRSEGVVNNKIIMRQEEAWLRRRTTNKETLVREDNSAIYPMLPGMSIATMEFGRRNSFFNHYVGKEYATNRHREVLSMGMEALFGKNFGGLIGLQQGIKADKDHRGFVLGILATA